MAKYLIQDIIPPEKRGHAHSAGAAVSQSKHKSASPRVHPHTIHKVEEHIANTEKQTSANESIANFNEAVPAVKNVDPKNMLANQMDEAVTPVGYGREDAVIDSFAGRTKKAIENTEGPVWQQNSTQTSNSADTFRQRMNFDVSSDEYPPKSWRGGWLPWFFALLGFGTLALLMMTYFSSATVTILPKSETIPLNQKILALKNPLNGELPYSVMKVTLEETREVPATGEKAVTAKASGKIIVYNKQSSPQRLIKNTRFESSVGKIYRINDSINVPKSVTKNGKVTPGSLEVSVYADEAGPDYNSAPVDFTLPGLKGSPTFDKVYARGKGPLTGGASGTIKSVSDLDLKQASDDLRVQLETKLRAKARAELATSQIGFDQGIIVELGAPELSKTQASSPDKAVVAQSGTLYYLTIDRNELVRTIATVLIPTFHGEEISIDNLDTLTIAIRETTGDELWKAEKVDLVIKGNPIILWKVKQDEIKKVMAGTPKDNFNAILAQFPTIERAKATISPLWKRTFPTNPDDISIEIVQSMPK